MLKKKAFTNFNSQYSLEVHDKENSSFFFTLTLFTSLICGLLLLLLLFYSWCGCCWGLLFLLLSLHECFKVSIGQTINVLSYLLSASLCLSLGSVKLCVFARLKGQITGQVLPTHRTDYWTSPTYA